VNAGLGVPLRVYLGLHSPCIISRVSKEPPQRLQKPEGRETVFLVLLGRRYRGRSKPSFLRR
jgi:hypothetical protein